MADREERGDCDLLFKVDRMALLRLQKGVDDVLLGERCVTSKKRLRGRLNNSLNRGFRYNEPSI